MKSKIAFLFLTTSFLVALSLAVARAKDIVSIVSDGAAEIDVKNRVATFINNALVTRKSSGSTLKADKLVLIKDANGSQTTMEAEGEVEIVKSFSPFGLSRQKTTIACDYFHMNREESLALMRGGVVVKSGGHRLAGEKIEYDYLEEKARITSKDGRQVKLIFRETKTKNDSSSRYLFFKRGFKAAADEILVNNLSQKIVLQGKAEVIDTGDKTRLKAGRIEIFFEYGRRIREVIANENVSMIRSGSFASAERAVFQSDKQVIFLTGDAYVKEKDKIEVRSSGVKILMKNGESVIKSLDDAPIKMKIPWKGP